MHAYALVIMVCIGHCTGGAPFIQRNTFTIDKKVSPVLTLICGDRLVLHIRP